MPLGVKSDHGAFQLNVPRDRAGNFEPQIVKKNQTTMTEQIEKKMLSLYALGNSYTQISEHIEEIFGFESERDSRSLICSSINNLKRTQKK